MNRKAKSNHSYELKMLKIILSLIIFGMALFPVSNALSESVVNEKGLDVREWKECGDKAISKTPEDMVQKRNKTTIDESAGAFDAVVGYGKWDVIFKKCGGKPTDGTLTNEMKDVLNKECTDNKYNAVNMLIAGDFYPYSDNSKLIKNAEKLCASIYDKNNKATASLQSKWSYGSSDDPMTSKKIKFAEVSSENTVEFGFPYTGQQVGKLIIRNHPAHGVEVMFVIGNGQVLCNSYSGCNIQIRFDDKKAENWKAIGPADNSNKILFISNDKAFIKKLSSTKVVRLKVPFYQEGEPVFEFHIGGLMMNMLNK